MIATDLKGKRRQLNRVDNLHYLSHSDFMACVEEVRNVGSLRSKKAGHLGSVSETQESSSSGPSADEGQTDVGEQANQESKVSAARVPRELEDFVKLQDPSNIDRNKIALSKPSGSVVDIFRKISYLTEEHAKSQNRFHRSGIASKGIAIQMGAKTGR
eukprot:130623-Amphidinium_carterae.1